MTPAQTLREAATEARNAYFNTSSAKPLGKERLRKAMFALDIALALPDEAAKLREVITNAAEDLEEGHEASALARLHNAIGSHSVVEAKPCDRTEEPSIGVGCACGKGEDHDPPCWVAPSPLESSREVVDRERSIVLGMIATEADILTKASRGTYPLPIARVEKIGHNIKDALARLAAAEAEEKRG